MAFSFRMKQEVKFIVHQTGRGKHKPVVSCSIKLCMNFISTLCTAKLLPWVTGNQAAFYEGYSKDLLAYWRAIIVFGVKSLKTEVIPGKILLWLLKTSTIQTNHFGQKCPGFLSGVGIRSTGSRKKKYPGVGASSATWCRTSKLSAYLLHRSLMSQKLCI